MSNSFQNVRPLRYWIQMVLPLVYDDSLSYMELLGKVIETLNQLVENNNKLPDYIMNLIKEYINSGEIKEVLQEVLSNFILNVKFPPVGITPAKGDGTADDSASIQECINYAATTGGVVYFPYGVYMCKDIELKDNVSLKGFDRYTTRLVGFGGAQTAVIKGTASNLTIADLSISANAGAQANQVDCINLQGSNYLFSNLFLVNAYRHLVLNTTAGHVQLDNIITNSAIDCSMYIDGAADVQASQIELGAIANTGTCSIAINTSNGVWDIQAKSSLEPAVIIGGAGNELTLSTISSEPVIPENNNNNIYVIGTSLIKQLSGPLKINGSSMTLNFLQDSFANFNDLTFRTQNLTVESQSVSCTQTNSTINNTQHSQINAGSIEIQSRETAKINSDESIILTSNQDIIIDSPKTDIQQIIKYNTPEWQNEEYGIINFLDRSDTPYSLMVGRNQTPAIMSSVPRPFIVTIGDSYADNENGWNLQMIPMLGMQLNQNYFTAAKGGAGFIASGGGLTFLDLLNKLDSEMSENDKNLVGKLLVGGGFNDNNFLIENIEAAITTFCQQAKQVFPYAKIYIACFGWCNSFTHEAVQIRLRLANTVIPGYRNGAALNNAIYIDNIEFACHWYNLYSDFIHPNKEGLSYLAKKLVEGLNKGTCVCDYSYQPQNYEVQTDIFKGGIIYGYNRLYNSQVFIYFNDFSIEFQEGKWPSWNEYMLLGTNNTVNIIAFERNTTMKVSGIITYTSNNDEVLYTNLNAQLCLENNTVLIRFMDVYQNGYLQNNAKQLNLIRFTGVNFNGSTFYL